MWTSRDIAGQPVQEFTPASTARFPLIFLTDWDDISPRDHGTWDNLFNDFQFHVYVAPSQAHWWLDRPESRPPERPTAWLLEQLVPEISLAFPRAPLGILGVGVGGAAALKLGFTQPHMFAACGALEATIDLHELYGRGTVLDEWYPAKERVRQDSPVLALRGYHVPSVVWLGSAPHSFWLRGNERLHEKLSALGFDHQTDFNTNVCGHSWSFYDTLAPRVLRAFAEGLTKESRKLK